MTRRIRGVAIVAALGLAGCMGGSENEAVEPETTATAGGTLTTDPQSGGAGGEWQARGDMDALPEEDSWEARGQFGQRDELVEDEDDFAQGGRPQDPWQQDQMQQDQLGTADELDDTDEFGGTRDIAPGSTGGEDIAGGGRDLQAQVEMALRSAPSIADDDITVHVDGSRVHLAGVVDSPTEIRIAHDVAHGIAGVDNVTTSDLRVQMTG